MTLTIREPGSAITHFIGMILAIFAAVPLLAKASLTSGQVGLWAMSVFMSSMILLYGASTLYHSVNCTGKKLKIFKKIDHMMIFVLIAGSYTPVCLLVLEPSSGYTLLLTVWAVALVGMAVKAFWGHLSEMVFILIYISMGWACLSVFGQLYSSLSTAAFLWLLSGGLLYTAGGVIYALKLPIFNSRHKNFGSHEIFIFL